MYYTTDKWLAHHGILGQKWGIRRFQNKDGTRTAAGKARQKEQSNDSSKENKDDKSFVEKYKKQIIAGIAIGSVAAGVTIAYKKGLFENIGLYMGAEGKDVVDEDIVEKAKTKTIKTINEAAEDIDPNDLPIPNQSHLTESAIKAMRDEAFTLEPGTTIKRQVGIKDWEPQKSHGALFTTFTEEDAKVYRERLSDWNKTGERYEVSMKLQKQLNVPSKATLREIVDNLYKNDPKFRNEVLKTQYKINLKLYSNKKQWPNLTPEKAKEYARQDAIESMSTANTMFDTAIYSMVGQRKDSKILSRELQKQGYNAIVDYFDKNDGSLGKTPLIILDKSTLVKTGEEYVGKIVNDRLVKD